MTPVDSRMNGFLVTMETSVGIPGEPWYSLNVHTFPSVRDMDRAVRGTPSSAARRNREENSGKFSE